MRMVAKTELELARARNDVLSRELEKANETIAKLKGELAGMQHNHARLVELIGQGAYQKPCEKCGGK